MSTNRLLQHLRDFIRRQGGGRVLDPDGKPVKGARLFWPHLPEPELKSEEDIAFSQWAKSDAEGRFCFELPRSDMHPEFPLALLAASARCASSRDRQDRNADDADAADQRGSDTDKIRGHPPYLRYPRSYFFSTQRRRTAILRR